MSIFNLKHCNCRNLTCNTPCCKTGPQGPRGIQGPQGIQGPTGVTSIDSILVVNDRISTTISNANINLGTIINQVGTSITFTSPDTITVSSGSYNILCDFLVANTSTSGDAGASLLINGIIISTAAEYIPATSTQSQIVLQHSITVTSTTTIKLKNASTVSNNYHDTSISVIKIA